MKLPLTLLLAVTIIQLNAQQKFFDQPVQLKSCNISITANAFVATTFVEMEFYNREDHEVEGYQQFDLQEGQAVTAFQLQLNGKYRDGSIEDRWKANRAYSTIVGKRVDPAILEMDYRNHYKLHIYPVPAHGSRKVTMTISQLMKDENTKLTYNLPLIFSGYTAAFHINITVNGKDLSPFCNDGLLHDQVFEMQNGKAVFDWETNNIQLNRLISFSIPLQADQPQLCISGKNGQANFLLRILPSVPQYYSVKPRSIAVFWDISLSASSRNIDRELDFLEKYLQANNISKAIITPFNHRVLNKIEYSREEQNFQEIKNYLLNYTYAGATVLGNLDLAAVQADAVLIFSDGQNTFGNSRTTAATVQVNCIVSATRFNRPQLEKMIGASGGTLIDLASSTEAAAIKKIELAENFLYGYNARAKHIKIDQGFPVRTGRSVLLSGTISGPDQLQLLFGNSNTTTNTLAVMMDTVIECNNDNYNTVQLLQAYNAITSQYLWQDMVTFGLKEKVVTPQTAFLVLERIEDYIKFNIAPPKELEQQCADLNYVYRSESRIRSLRTYTEQELLQPAVTRYNQRIQWWDKNASLIDLSKPIIVEATQGDRVITNMGKATATAEPVAFKGPAFASASLSEVVVTAMGIKRQMRQIGYSTSVISAEELNRARIMDIANGMSGKVAGLEVRLINNGVRPETRIILRGSRSLIGNNQALLVVDDVVLPMNYLNTINPNDVESINILKGGAASALYGSEASNGVIIVSIKKGSRSTGYSWGRYKLSSADDEDYLQEMKNATSNQYWEIYQRLEMEHKDKPGFYFDMADFFHAKGREAQAMEVLYNAAEKTNGGVAGLRAVAYTLESWKRFEDAIAVYINILDQNKNETSVQRDLALAYFQNGNYQQALDAYYAIITKVETDPSDNSNLKEQAISEMNALIAMHSDSLDLTGINLRLVRPLPVDLRISIEGNNNIYNFRVQEPGGAIGGGENEYSIRFAVNGKYRLITDAYDVHSYDGSPQLVRVIIFRNFQKANQSIEIRNVILDNQYGEVEIGDVKW